MTSVEADKTTKRSEIAEIIRERRIEPVYVYISNVDDSTIPIPDFSAIPNEAHLTCAVNLNESTNRELLAMFEIRKDGMVFKYNFLIPGITVDEPGSNDLTTD